MKGWMGRAVEGSSTAGGGAGGLGYQHRHSWCRSLETLCGSHMQLQEVEPGKVPGKAARPSTGQWGWSGSQGTSAAKCQLW